MRSLVTGGHGFIGRHLVRALLARGDEVSVVDRLPPDTLTGDAVLGRTRYLQADLTVPAEATAAIAAVRPERVFHLASAVDVRRDLAVLDEQVRCTQMAAVHVALAFLEHGVQREVAVPSRIAPRKFAERKLPIDDSFLQRKMPEIQSSAGLTPSGDLVQDYLYINRELRKSFLKLSRRKSVTAVSALCLVKPWRSMWPCAGSSLPA